MLLLNGFRLVSLDFWNISPNIPSHQCTQIILTKTNGKRGPSEEIIKTFQLCVDENCFQFESHDSELVDSIVGIFMDSWIQNVWWPVNQITQHRRLGIWVKSEKQELNLDHSSKSHFFLQNSLTYWLDSKSLTNLGV